MKKIRPCVYALLLLLGVWLGNGYISFGYGSFAGFLAEQRRLPQSEKLALLRSAAVRQLTQAHAEFSSLAGLTLHTTTYSDLCSKGTHSWKREDPYAYVCAYRITCYYGTQRDYTELLLEIERSLNALGWTIQNRSPAQPTISDSIRQYTGEIFLVDLPVYVKQVSGETLSLTVNGFDGYGGYWTETSTEPSPLGFGTAPYQDVYTDAANESPAAIFNAITASGQEALMLTISVQYFRN